MAYLLLLIHQCPWWYRGYTFLDISEEIVCLLGNTQRILEVTAALFTELLGQDLVYVLLKDIVLFPEGFDVEDG